MLETIPQKKSNFFDAQHAFPTPENNSEKQPEKPISHRNRVAVVPSRKTHNTGDAEMPVFLVQGFP